MRLSIYLLAGISLLGASCKKFLDVQPEQQVDDSQAITNLGSAETAVNGLYNLLGNDSYYGSNFQALSYLSGGDIQWTGSQSAPAQIANRQITADNANVASSWAAIYRTILSANYIIDVIPKLADPLFTQVKKDQLTGEAYFVRALSYFDLARGWGGVQLILTPTRLPGDHAGIKRSSLDETYQQVLSDLNKAAELLPLSTNRNRATRKTAWALKARYFLYRQQWDSADLYATRIIDDVANYRLLKPYNAFFANNATATAESVFEISYSVSFKNGHFNWWLPPALGGRREWAPNAQLVALLNDPAIGGNRNALIGQTAPPGNLWYGKLYYRTPTGTDPAYLIRIAELYLIRAEARAKNGLLTEALQDLNAIRDRAGIAPSTADTKEAILLAIENERRLEFAFEGDRWFDLVRTGRVANVLGLTDKNRYVFPIPADELLADGNLDPNPGY
ncbi:RagB/SusD family nutrient uptake outer membrane protein [Chitinophaga filiformis]|uniref:RagB/SusD family nutrient uptake outer membrane protein n=1 Tax=Chitinophaga filiformis TaxID=104663 RepID=A0ABY4I824_CHIFI|nr:RagB/SusD family nutrient uptake outer membrane protein [Chitinophaga filiformis]UPK71803.1 RagB/SusD family nutrient uptake outer membrane protein [Chitinophaga filiformis]